MFDHSFGPQVIDFSENVILYLFNSSQYRVFVRSQYRVQESIRIDIIPTIKMKRGRRYNKDIFLLLIKESMTLKFSHDLYIPVNKEHVMIEIFTSASKCI